MQKNYNENLVAGAAIRDDKGRRISKLFEASHPKMTVGYAKNLIMPDDPTEQEFNFRQAGGGVIEDGVAVIDKVKGNSVVWNQLIKDFREPSNWLTGGNDVTIVGDKIHIKFASTSPSNAYGIKSSAFFAGHKYCILMNNENAMPLTAIKLGSAITVGDSGTTINSLKTPAITDAIPTGSVGDAALWFWPSDETKLEGDFSNIYAIDLTQMFGAGNEPSTYEEFLQRKPKIADEFAYNEGTIVNNKVEKVVSTGRNLWDEQWELGSLNAQGEPVATTASIRSKEFNRCLPNCEICFSCQSAAAKLIYWYDVNKAFISRNEVSNSTSIYGVTTSPANAYFFKIRNDKSTYNHDICINLSDPAINGKYFPYEEHTLDLSWIKEIKDAEGVKLFEDGMRSAGTAFDEVAKNKAVKRLGVKVYSMSEVSAAPNTYSNITYFSLPKPNDSASKGSIQKQHSTSKYPYNSNNTGWDNANFIGQFFDSADYKFYWVGFAKGTTLEQAKEAIDGLVVNYELADPIEVEYDEKSLTYPVVAGGTEEAIASEPSSAFRADIGYGIDAVKTILDLKARVEALEGK